MSGEINFTLEINFSIRVCFLEERLVSSLAFKEVPDVKRSRREKLIQIDGRSFYAIQRQTLRIAGRESKQIYVLPGQTVIGKLPPETARRVKAFSDNIIFYRERGQRSEIAAWKMRVTAADSRQSEPIEQQAMIETQQETVAWDLGPIMVLHIGELHGEPVCITPVRVPRQKSLFPSDSTIDDQIVLNVLADQIIACLDEYMSDIADLLLSAFFQKKESARRVAAKIEKIIEKSIRGKINFISDRKSDENTALKQDEIIGHYKQDLMMYSAAATVASAAAACLTSCVGDSRDWRILLNEAHTQVFRLSDEIIEKPALIKCVELLRIRPSNDDLSALSTSAPKINRWLADLVLACRFVSEIRNLIDDHGADSIFIFISHHMDVYASEDFYEAVDQYASKNFASSFRIWTGKGRQQHIQIAILAKLWLSDVQMLYVPNSLDTFTGNIKDLRSSGDWVIEELTYGFALEKPLHCVIGQNSTIREKLQQQLESYSWESLAKSFGHVRLPMAEHNFNEIGPTIATNLNTHWRERSYSLHHPRGKRLSPEDATLLGRGCFHFALKRRFGSMLWGLRLSLKPDWWRIVQILVRLSQQKLAEGEAAAVTAEEIVKAWGNESRLDGGNPSQDWVRKTLWTLQHRTISLGKNEYTTVSEGNRKARFKTYRIGFDQLVEAVQLHYNVPVPKNELDEILRQVLEYPVGAFYGESNRFEQRSGI